VVTETTQGQKVKIVFVRHRHKRDWLAILSTRIDLPDAEIVRIYGKRWDIEVFFKMLKHYLNLEREVQLRDYDGLIGHITIMATTTA
jgi:IS4 transposase